MCIRDRYRVRVVLSNQNKHAYCCLLEAESEQAGLAYLLVLAVYGILVFLYGIPNAIEIRCRGF